MIISTVEILDKVQVIHVDGQLCSLLNICSLVGSLNKIPLSVAGIVLFKVPTSLENSASILFGKFSPSNWLNRLYVPP